MFQIHFSRSTDTIDIAIGGVLFSNTLQKKSKRGNFLTNCNGKLVEHLYFSDFSTQKGLVSFSVEIIIVYNDMTLKYPCDELDVKL